MSGTSLVILAMYTTINVARGSQGRLDPGAVPVVAALLLLAALLAGLAIWLESTKVRRRATAGPALPSLKRRHTGPAARRH